MGVEVEAVLDEARLRPPQSEVERLTEFLEGADPTAIAAIEAGR